MMHRIFFGVLSSLLALSPFHAHQPSPAPLAPIVTPSHSGIRVPIFIYHTIAEDRKGETKEQHQFSITPENLEAQLKYLSENGYTTITLHQLYEMMQAGTTSPITKPVVLTFDDGWQTQFDHALPLLLKYHQVGVFFIYPNPIGRDDRFMTWDELHTLVNSGMTIGDHSYTHPLFSKLTSEELQHEVGDSKTVLEQKLDVHITDFASPFGYMTPEVIASLRKNGYETGRTTDKGMVHTATSTLSLTGYLIHRDINDFVFALRFAP